MSDLDSTQVRTADDSISSIGEYEVYLKLVSPVDNFTPSEYPLSKETTVGRSSPSDVIIPVQSLSKQHAKITYSNGQYFVQDLASSNKTFLNKVQLTPNVLYAMKYGDELQFGDITCLFEKSNVLLPKHSEKQLSYIPAASTLQEDSYPSIDDEFDLTTPTEQNNNGGNVQRKSFVDSHVNNDITSEDSADCIPSTQAITDSYDDDIEPVQPMKIWNKNNNRMIRPVTQVRTSIKFGNSSSPNMHSSGVDNELSSSIHTNRKQNGIGSEHQAFNQSITSPVRASSSLLNNNDNFEEYHADEILIGCNTIPATLPLIEQTNLNMNDQLEIVSSSQPLQSSTDEQKQDIINSEQVTVVNTTTTTIIKQTETNEINAFEVNTQSYDLEPDEIEMAGSQQEYVGETQAYDIDDSDEIKSLDEEQQQQVATSRSEQVIDEIVTKTTTTTTTTITTRTIIDIPFDLQKEEESNNQVKNDGERRFPTPPTAGTLAYSIEDEMADDEDRTPSPNPERPPIPQTLAYQLMPDNDIEDDMTQSNGDNEDLSLAPNPDMPAIPQTLAYQLMPDNDMEDDMTQSNGDNEDLSLAPNPEMPAIPQTLAYQLMPDNDMEDDMTHSNGDNEDLSLAPSTNSSSKALEEEKSIEKQPQQSVIASQPSVDDERMDSGNLETTGEADQIEPSTIESTSSKSNDIEAPKMTPDREENKLQKMSSTISEFKPHGKNQSVDDEPVNQAENKNDRLTSNVDDHVITVPNSLSEKSSLVTKLSQPPVSGDNEASELFDDIGKDVAVVETDFNRQPSTETAQLTSIDEKDEVATSTPSETHTSAGAHLLFPSVVEKQLSEFENENNSTTKLNTTDVIDNDDIKEIDATTNDQPQSSNKTEVQTDVDEAENDVMEPDNNEPSTSVEDTTIKPTVGRRGVSRKNARRAHGRKQKVVSSKLHGNRGRRNAIIPTANEPTVTDITIDETVNTENEDNMNDISEREKLDETLPLPQEKEEPILSENTGENKVNTKQKDEKKTPNVRHSQRIRERATSGKIRGFPYDYNEYVDLDELEKTQTNRKTKTPARQSRASKQLPSTKRKSLRQHITDDQQEEEKEESGDNNGAEPMAMDNEEIQNTKKGFSNKRKRKTTALTTTTATISKRNRTSAPSKSRTSTKSVSSTVATPLTNNRRRKLPLPVTPAVDDKISGRSISSSTITANEAKRQKRSNQPTTSTNISKPSTLKAENNSGRTRSKSRTPKSARADEDDQQQVQQQLVLQTSTPRARQSGRQQFITSSKQSSAKPNKKQKTSMQPETEEVEEERPVRIALSSHLVSRSIMILFKYALRNFNQQQLDLLKKLGFDIIDESCQVDVLVVDRIRRTKKFFMCLGRGAHIVSPTWIYAMLRDEKYYPIDKFYLNDQQAEQRYGFNLKESVRLAKQRPIFAGYKIFCTKDTSPPFEDLKDIIEAAGGKLVDKISMHRPAKDLICIVAQKHKQEYANLNKRNIPIVSEEFALSGISKQRLDFDTALTSTPPVTASQNIASTSTTQSTAHSSASHLPSRK
ncbi:unnamed protein product [Didymodactylos carnosus]|uniref:Mediator of DNA damage checkpoint protein 1 n=1 Tax=Didymodactylos carnosus TaxID=1234261 RepID=A0A813P3J6_9BILA|nr:unnamed protein product [Didymodactylos carnosus]CAF3523136.1 unnamed protein product [Didymodactylos carnosus]